jgi:hypothetical protein
MNLKIEALRYFAHYSRRKIDFSKHNAVSDQLNIMKNLVRTAKTTRFGKDHQCNRIQEYDDFKGLIPLRDYEQLTPYINQILAGESDVLWPGKPKYFAKTSGTTSGIKYIPITRDSMPNHINTARNALMNYISLSGNADIFKGNLIFLSGSPELEEKAGIPTGRLSGIVNHEVPGWVRSNQLPSLATNTIEDWEAKLEKIVEETIHRDMRLISGIPPWVQMYYERLLEKKGKSTIAEVFPNYGLFMYGGVNFEPYRAKLESLVGKNIDSIETYPASEGFIAYQDTLTGNGLLLNTNSGIFFEFVPVEEIHKENPVRLHLGQVSTNVDYAIIINNNAGLWGYSIGDCVRFTSLDPYRIIVSGRVKHFISAFGEHVIGKEVEEALMGVCKIHDVKVIEFTVAPQVSPPEGGSPYHEWFIEFDEIPSDMELFSLEVDQAMCQQNIYYDDLIKGNILQHLKISVMEKNSFRNFMKESGKLGGQNKVPRLSNDRKIADDLQKYIMKK